MPLARLLALLFALLALPDIARAGDLIIDTPDGPRHALVAPDAGGPRPTVIVLHGALGTGTGYERRTGFAEAANARGFAAVFPDGLSRQWHDGRRGGPDGPDDVAFLTALVARLVADGIADPRRIYLAGISNGGMMTFTMACKAGGLFAGIATVIANMPEGLGACSPRPMPVVMINGTADPMVPYRGGEVGLRGGRGEVWSVERTIEFFARLDGCGPTRSEDLPHLDAGDGPQVKRIAWSGCRAGTSVTLYQVEGGGHALPGQRSLMPRLLGPSTRDIDAASVILDTFARRG